MKVSRYAGLNLIELLVIISIIALLSAVVFASLQNARMKAHDAQRVAQARQLGISLEQYETSYGTYKVAGAGSEGEGVGYAAKTGAFPTSIISALKAGGSTQRTSLRNQCLD